MVTHSSILAWKVPSREEPGDLQSACKEWGTTEHTHTIFHGMRVSHLLHAFICQWIFRLFHVLLIVNGSAWNIGMRVPFQV